MNQQEFDKQFLEKHARQPSMLDYMEEEVALLKKFGKKVGLKISTIQATIFWEYYSEARDATWMSGRPEHMQETFSNFLNDPQAYWEYPI